MLRITFASVRASFENLVTEAGARVEAYGICERKNAGWLLAVAACAFLPLEIFDLASMIVGVLAYLLVQAFQNMFQENPEETQMCKALPGKAFHPVRNGAGSRHAGAGPAPRAHKPRAAPPCPEEQKASLWTPSAMPIVAPTFESTTWDAEVQELLGRIFHTPQGDAAVAHIVQCVRQAIAHTLPEAKVAGFAYGNIVGGTAFGVAVPEVDIVISVNPQILRRRLQSKGQAKGSFARLDEQKLQKSAIRMCTDRLVSTGFFKFRRSAFRGDEPKVIIIAPADKLCRQGVPVNLSVNAVVPHYHAALVAECGRLEPRALELILLVKRWAKDRGLCHAAKGHLSPYIWMLLVIFFFQVNDTDEGSLLPPLADFESCSGHPNGAKGKVAARGPPQAAAACGGSRRSVGSLFKDFVAFYAGAFDWRAEAVCVRLGRRGPPDPALPLHVVVEGTEGSAEVGPSIEDPFEPTRNLGDCTTATSLAHLRSELQRARQLCADSASLSELLQPWAPPEIVAGQRSEEQEEEK